MEYPKLTPIPREHTTVDVFRGLNRNERIGSGEFRRMENLTSDCYPVLSPRQRRQTVLRPASPQGLLAKEELCYVDGTDLVVGISRIPMGLSTDPEHCPKQMISMGAYVIILPDKCYVNTRNLEDRGHMDAELTAQTLALELCREDGTQLTPAYTQPDAPESPENGDIWLDNAQSVPSLKQWAAATDQWVSITASYLRLTAPGLGTPFRQWDSVTITGLGVLEDTTAPIYARGEDFLVIPGILPQVTAQVETPVTVSRKSPELDFCIECGNRLWGCRFGTDAYGEPVNRLYASKLGDFKNWQSFLGLSTDSYYVNLGSDGPFTGAIAHMGNPLFFKENWLHKVYGTQPSEFSLLDTPCRGVQPGCHRSLAIVGETLFYKSRSGVCAYDGSLPADISYPLGREVYGAAVAGAHGSKYYLSVEGREQNHLLVFDTVRNLWHREDDFRASGFASFQGRLYAIDDEHLNILVLSGAQEPEEEPVSWLAETGELGLGTAQRKYISRIQLRLSMAVGAYMDVYAQYDQSDTWEHLCHIRGTSLTSFCVPVRPRRCDFLRLRFQGRGEMKLYAMTKSVEKGSEW